jgi:uncharacterized delta-60 repeat protein
MRVRYVLFVAAMGCGVVKTAPPPGGSNGGTLSFAMSTASVAQGGSADVPFMLATPAGAALTVHVDGLPTGVTAPDVGIASGATTGSIAFAATTASPLDVTTELDVQLLDGAAVIDERVLAVRVVGAAGALDTTFGIAGRAVVPLPDPVIAAASGNGLARAITLVPTTGEIVIAAQLDTTGTAGTTYKLGIVKLSADGAPDPTFGGGRGYTILDGSAANATEFLPTDVQIDSQGRIVLLARHFILACNIYIARLLADGTPDPTFTTVDIGPPGGFCGATTSLAILPNDKLLVAGNWNNPDTSQRLLLAQFNKDGSPDNTAFAGSFAVRMPNPDSGKQTLISNHLLVDAQGRYVVAGVKCDGGWNASLSACESVVGRITATGAWDTTFNTTGYSALTFGTTTNAPQGFSSIRFDANGDIIAVGYDEGYTTGTIARFLASNGAVDNTFATSGRTTPTLVAGGTVQELDDLAIDAQGRIVISGYAVNGGPLIVATRYNANGTIDTTYGTGGVQTAPAGGLQTQALLQADGRFVVAGTYPRTGGGTDVALWRFWP